MLANRAIKAKKRIFVFGTKGLECFSSPTANRKAQTRKYRQGGQKGQIIVGIGSIGQLRQQRLRAKGRSKGAERNLFAYYLPDRLFAIRSPPMPGIAPIMPRWKTAIGSISRIVNRFTKRVIKPSSLLPTHRQNCKEKPDPKRLQKRRCDKNKARPTQPMPMPNTNQTTS